MLFKRIYEIVKDNIALYLSKRKLRKYLSKNNINEIINTTKDFIGYGIYDRISMSQKFDEISRLAKLIREKSPKIIMEIGTRKGGTLYTWCRISNPDLVISIDLPGGIHGGGYNEKKKKLYREFLSDKPNTQLYLLQLNSHSHDTLNKVLDILKGRKIDFLFIDGDHTYEGVRSDFEMYSNLVRQEGIIAFHDIVPNLTNHEDASTIEVPRFWKEVKMTNEYEEIISKTGNSWMGIGVLKYKNHNSSFTIDS